MKTRELTDSELWDDTLILMRACFRFPQNGEQRNCVDEVRSGDPSRLWTISGQYSAEQAMRRRSNEAAVSAKFL